MNKLHIIAIAFFSIMGIIGVAEAVDRYIITTLDTGQTTDPYTLKDSGGNTIAKIDTSGKFFSNGNQLISNVTASYIIATDGTTTFAINGTTGVIDHSGTDADVVIQLAIDDLETSNVGGKILFKEGTYVISDGAGRPIVINGNFIEIECESWATIFDFSTNSGFVFTFRNNTNIGAFGLDSGNPSDKPHHGSVKGCSFLGDPDGVDSQFINFLHYDFGIVEGNRMISLGDEAIEFTDGDYGIIQNNYIFNASAVSASGAAISIQVGSDNILVHNNFINQTGPDNVGGSGIQLSPVTFLHPQNVTISDNIIIGTGSECINLIADDGTNNSNNMTNIIISGNQLYDCYTHAIFLNGENQNTIKNIIISNNIIQEGGNDAVSSGIRCSDLHKDSNVLIEGNQFISFGASNTGQDTESINCQGTIVGNFILNSGGDGIQLTNTGGQLFESIVMGNTIINSGQQNSGTQAGIYVTSVSVGTRIIGNTLLDVQATPTQDDGILLEGSTGPYLVHSNYFSGNAVEAIDDDSTGNISRIFQNIGVQAGVETFDERNLSSIGNVTGSGCSYNKSLVVDEDGNWGCNGYGTNATGTDLGTTTNSLVGFTKGATTIVNNSETCTSTPLSVDLEAGKLYLMRGGIGIQSSSTADADACWSASGGLTVTGHYTSEGSNKVYCSNIETCELFLSVTSTTKFFGIYGLVETGGSDGTLTFELAQGTATVLDLKLLSRSWITFEEIGTDIP